MGIPVVHLNQTTILQLKTAFAVSLHIPTENVEVDKIRIHGNAVEMYFVRPDAEVHLTSDFNPRMDANEFLFSSDEIISSDLLEEVQKEVPLLNITSIYSMNEIISSRFTRPIWMEPYFPYIVAFGSFVIVLSVSLIVYCCCCRRKKKKDPLDVPMTRQIVCPTMKPDMKNPLGIQPEDEGPMYASKGCITPLPAQPLTIKAKRGLLERRGSSASLTLDLNPSPEQTPRWNGTPPKEVSALEYLLSAGNRLSRRDLRNVLKNTKKVYEEFWEIPSNYPEKVYVAGSGMKNRYKSIIPNEHSRVVLPDSEWDPLSSYINANYIRGYEGEPNAYIATQGPLAHTIVDFWRMVWHEKAPIIVMITKLKEKNKPKCENYLPEIHSTYGDIEVIVERLVQRAGYVVRYITLRSNGESHSLIHYWYTAWPDHKPPDNPRMLLDLVKEVELNRYDDFTVKPKGPVVVHCSAAIGRTGCFVAISVGIRQLREEHSVDILGVVCSMRVDRGGMIQTHEQYEFIHQALCEYEKQLTEQSGPGE